MDSKALLTGTITLLILLVLMGVDEFYSWLTLTLVGYLASALFVVPIAYAIIERKITKNTLCIIEVGFLILIFYMFLSGKSPYDIMINLLQTIVVITLLSTMVRNIKNWK